MATATFDTQMTVGQLLAAYPHATFFVELIDTTTTKCYGIQTVPTEQVDRTRVIGAYGRRTRTFTAPFEVLRGHKLVSVRASAKKPVTCTEHLYGSYQ